MNTDLLIEKLAYKNALELRLCPPLDLLINEQSDEATLHLKRCGLCQLKLEMKEDYEAIKEFTDKFKTQREPNVNKMLAEGQLWHTSISLWGVDGNYYNSITVVIISVDETSHSCRVAMHFHEALLSGPGDVLLDGFPGFVEGWNTFNLHADFFKDGTYIDEITNDNLSELKRMDIYFNKNLYREIYFSEPIEEMDEISKKARLKFESIITDIDSRNFKQIKKGTAKYEFRKTEIKVSSLFGLYTTQMLMDDLENVDNNETAEKQTQRPKVISINHNNIPIPMDPTTISNAHILNDFIHNLITNEKTYGYSVSDDYLDAGTPWLKTACTASGSANYNDPAKNFSIDFEWVKDAELPSMYISYGSIVNLNAEPIVIFFNPLDEYIYSTHILIEPNNKNKFYSYKDLGFDPTCERWAVKIIFRLL